MTTAATHRLAERCRLCSCRDDVRLVRPLVSASGAGRVYGRAIVLCAGCRRRTQRKWKWPSADHASSGTYAAQEARA